MLCGCAAGKAQCWKEAELQCDTHFVFSVFQESSESDYSIIAEKVEYLLPKTE